MLEVCRDFRLPQFKTADLPVPESPSPPPAPDHARGAGAPKPEKPPGRGLFSSYTKKKRFSFFG